MTRQTRHVRILAFPFADSFQSAQLDALYEEMHGQQRDFIVDYRELRLSTPATLINCDGRPCEHVQGYYLPRRLRCSDVGWLECTGLYTRLDGVQRVLVHCSAGFNRSVTVCCAALILLEGISAENALERVREHHPWARPDAHHWLVLRWLAQRFTSGC